VISPLLTNTPISLDENHLGAVNVQYIANHLKINTTLRHLDLVHCSIDEQGAEALLQGLKYNLTLKIIM
jgi:hypothetical protein